MADIATLGIRVTSDGLADATRQLLGLESAGSKAERSVGELSRGFGTLRNAITALGIGVVINEFVQAGDQMSLLSARLKLVTSSTHEFAQAQEAVKRIAYENRMGLAETTTLFTKLSDPVKRAGGGIREVQVIVDSFTKALKISGANTQEAAAATLQFAQAMASGKLSGDEFRTLAEVSPRFMKAIAEGANLPIEKLKQLAGEGKLTMDVLGNAMIAINEKLKQESSVLPKTVHDAMQEVRNDIFQMVSDLNKSSGFNDALVAGIKEMRGMLPSIKAELEGAFSSVAGWMERNKGALGDVWTQAKGLAGTVWEIAGAAGRVVGFVTEMIGKSRAVEVAFGTVRVLVAGIHDGINIMVAGVTQFGGAIIRVSGWIADLLLQPIGMMIEGWGRLGELVGLDVGTSIKNIGISLQNATKSTYALANGASEAAGRIVSGFANGNTEVAKALTSFEKASKSAEKTGDAAKKAAEGYVDLKGAVSGAANKGESDYKKILKAAAEYSVELDAQAAKGEKLSKAEKMLADAKQGLASREFALVKVLLEGNIAKEKQFEANQDWLKFQEEANRASQQRLATLDAAAQAAEDEVRYYGMSKAAIELETIARLENNRAIVIAHGATAEQLKDLDAEIAARKRLAAAMGQKDVLDAQKKAAEQSAKYWEKFADDIERGLTDSLYRSFESGQGFGETFVNSLKITLKAAALKVVVQAIVDPVMGTIRGATGFGGGAGASGGYGDPSQSLGFMSTLANGNQAYYSAYSQFAYSSVGQTLGLSGNVMGPPTAAGQYGAGLTSAGQFAQDALPYLPAVISAANGQWGSAIGSAAGAYFGGPIGSVIGSMIGSMFDGGGEDPHNNAQVHGYTFGINRQGVYGTGVPEAGGNGTNTPMSFAAGPTSGSGWWGDSTAMTTDQVTAITNQVQALFSGAEKLAGYIGATTEALDAIDINSVTDGSGGNGRISNYFASADQALSVLSDRIATALVPNIADFRAGTESLSQTLDRVVGNMQTVDAWGTRLGFTLGGLSDKNSLANAFGGAGNMDTALGAYYQAYYTEQERTARMGEELSASFARLNEQMPTSKDALRAMISATVDSKDGWEQTYASLVALSGPFADYIAALDGTGQAVASNAELLRTRQQLQDQLDVLTGTRTQQQIDRAAQLAGTTDAATQALMQQVFALQDQQSAATSAAEAARQAAEAEANLVQARQQWQDQLDVLTGARTQQEIERTSLLASTSDLATKALMEHVFALQDQQSAAQSAAQALADATRQRDDLLMQFGTGQEQLAMQTDRVNEAFSRLGMAVPNTVAAFRKIAETANANTDAGRAIISTLNDVAGAFKNVVSAGQNSYIAAYNPNTIRKAMQAALPELAKGAANDASYAEKTLSTQLGLAKTIDDLIYRLRASSIDNINPELAYQQVKQDFMLVSAKASMGDEEAIRQLSDVSGNFLEASKAYWGSGQGAADDYEMTLQRLGDVQGTTRRQVSIAEQQLAALQEISNKLNPKPGSDIANANALDAYAQTGYNVARSQVMGTAWGNLLPESFSSLKSSYDLYRSANPDVEKIAAGQAGTDQAIAISNFFSSNGLRGLIDVVNAPEMIKSGQNIHMAGLARFLWDSFIGGNRAFADGGLAAPGWALVGERGPEIVNFSAPARVYTADQTRGMLNASGSGADTESKQLLREQNDLLRAMLSQQGQASSAQQRRLESLDRRLAQIESDGSLLRSAA